MAHPSLWTALLVFLAGPVIASANELADHVVEWVVSQGGYFSSKLEIRGMAPSDPSSPLGVFAKENLEAHEHLMFVPKSAYVEIDDLVPLDNSEDAKWYYANYCRLSQKLKSEMEKGDTSDFAPYMRYLQHQRKGQLPATWSQAGKDLLRLVLPANHDGVDWIEKRFRGSCIGDDPLEEHAVALTIQRGFDHALIPIWDMVNHRNGRVNVEHASIWHKDGFKLRASRDIGAGEELYATYDMCLDCGNIWWYWGTSEILRDFGFVENYKQRWVYYDKSIWFELDYDKSGNLKVTWDTDQDFEDETPEQYDVDDDDEAESYGVPNKISLEFLRNELQRLNDVEAIVRERAGGVPKHEYDTVLLYHRAATVAMSKAIESATDSTPSQNSSREL